MSCLKNIFGTAGSRQMKSTPIEFTTIDLTLDTSISFAFSPPSSDDPFEMLIFLKSKWLLVILVCRAFFRKNKRSSTHRRRRGGQDIFEH